jgi:hypothetical protein
LVRSAKEVHAIKVGPRASGSGGLHQNLLSRRLRTWTCLNVQARHNAMQKEGQSPSLSLLPHEAEALRRVLEILER